MHDTYLLAIEKYLTHLQLGQSPRNLYDPMHYIMQLGGKRIRPVLVHLAYALQKEPDQNLLPVASAVELFHNFSLIHDDIMDQAPLRRGKPTVHEKWNMPTAILSGDALLIKAYQLLLKSPVHLHPIILEKFNQCALEVCEGQQLDMDFESNNLVTEEEYVEMIRLKTAVLLGFSLELGGIMAEMDAEQTEKLRKIGENLGIAFQLKDDYLDVFGTSQLVGKKVGGDIDANKKTILWIRALEKADTSTKQLLLQISNDSPPDKVEKITSIYRSLGVHVYIENKINDYTQKAFDIIDDLNGNLKQLEQLKIYIQSLPGRQK